MKNFRTYQMAKDFYLVTKGLAFKNPARDQFQRALLSVCLNLSEGSGKSTARDRAHFYSIALGSLREVQALLDLHEYHKEYEIADQLGAMIFRLIQRPGSMPELFKSRAGVWQSVASSLGLEPTDKTK